MVFLFIFHAIVREFILFSSGYYWIYCIASVTEEIVQPMLVKHDYRDIKVGEDTTITIDVEELKRQMKKDFYRNLGIGFYPGA